MVTEGAAKGCRFYHVRIQCALGKKVDLPHLLRFFFKHLNKEPTDDLPFLLRICHSLRLCEEPWTRVNEIQIDVKLIAECPHDRFALPFSHQSVVDMNARESVANRPVDQDGRNG